MLHLKKRFQVISISIPIMVAAALTANATTKAEFSAAVKSAGAVLPDCVELNDGAISISLPKSLGGRAMSFSGTLDADALADGQFVFQCSEKSKIKWDNAFGLDFVDLDELQLDLKIADGEIDLSLVGLPARIRRLTSNCSLLTERCLTSRYLFRIPLCRFIKCQNSGRFLESVSFLCQIRSYLSMLLLGRCRSLARQMTRQYSTILKQKVGLSVCVLIMQLLLDN